MHAFSLKNPFMEIFSSQFIQDILFLPFRFDLYSFSIFFFLSQKNYPLNDIKILLPMLIAECISSGDYLDRDKSLLNTLRER